MNKNIKFFLGFICGGLLVVFLLSTDFFVIGVMGSYEDRDAISRAFVDIQNIKNDIVFKLENNEAIRGGGIDFPKSNEIESIYVFPDGNIILNINTSTGHIVWLHPIEETDGIRWECKGAPQKGLPDGCF